MKPVMTYLLQAGFVFEVRLRDVRLRDVRPRDTTALPSILHTPICRISATRVQRPPRKGAASMAQLLYCTGRLRLHLGAAMVTHSHHVLQKK